MVGNTHFQVKCGTRNWETLTFQVKREGIQEASHSNLASWGLWMCYCMAAGM